MWYAFTLSYLTIENLSDERDIIIQVVNEVKENKWCQKQQPQHAFLSRIYKKKTNQKDAIVCYEGKIDNSDVILGVMNFEFIGGSMGSVVGEKVARSIKLADEQKVPLIIVCASGGARMQEGALSLMQLAKTSANLAKFMDNGGLYIPLLTNPTTGGVTASYGMLGDIILAEPKALIGFAGPRVIKQTISHDLPEGFQRSEFLLEKGFIDRIVERSELKETFSKIIRTLT